MMKLKFLGAAGMVTGSCYWLQGRDSGLVIDMGMFQGFGSRELNLKWPEIDVTKVGGVLLTHAHLDHCGRLPLLVRMGYKGKIYMTEPTRDLVELSLYDTVKINRENGGQELFNEDDVDRLLSQVEFFEIGEVKEIAGFEVGFFAAGHILGAVSIRVRLKGEKERFVVFSGDLGTGESPLIKPPSPPEMADVVVMESTYGDRLHEEEDEKLALKEEIKQVLKSRGTLLLPVFSIQRSQRILHLLDHIQKEGGLPKNMKVYFDSPMAIEATRIFGRYGQYFGSKLSAHAGEDDPFDFEGLVVTKNAWEKRIIRKDKNPKIIIAGSGMMSGGRMMGHAKEYLPLASTRLLIVGYQAKGTLGRQIVDGEKLVSINGVKVEVRASVKQIHSMSAHADQRQLLSWLGSITGVSEVVLTHGEDEAREALALKVQERGLRVRKPTLNESIEF